MRVEQAVYGEIRGGHALRASSPTGAQLARELTSRLDLPDTAPPGTHWSPFLRGFPYAGHFVLARTFLDASATRAGMVLSHAVFAPLEEFTYTQNIGSVAALLLDAPKTISALSSVMVDSNTTSTAPPDADDLIPAAEALVARGQGPVVRVGNKQFDELIIALWFRLWPALRRNFSFRLSFGPHDLVESLKPSLVCTPTALVTRWQQYRIIGSAALEPISPAASMLCGSTEANNVIAFAHEIGAQLDSLSDLPLLGQAYKLSRLESANLDQSIATMRLTERLSPSPELGAVGKSKIISKVIQLLPQATTSEILPLRNLACTGFATIETLWAALSRWLAFNLFAPDQDAAMLAIVEDTTSISKAIPQWSASIVDGFAIAFDQDNAALATAIWRWFSLGSSTVEGLLKTLSNTRDIESNLVKHVPQILERSPAEAAMSVALHHGWLRLHGAAVSSAYSAIDAVRRQIAVDRNPTEVTGVRLALRKATPADILDFALQLGEARIMQLACENAAANPQLLRHVNMEHKAAQTIWARSLEINPKTWDGPESPRRSFDVVLNKLLDEKIADLDLVTELAKSPLSDLSDYERRSEVWSRVSAPARADLLAGTSEGWLTRSSLGSPPYYPDSELQVTILAHKDLDRILNSLCNGRESAALQILNSLPAFDEARFLRWLEGCARANPSMTQADAETIGRLILTRRWAQAVNMLVKLVRDGKQTFRPALRLCYEMLDLWTRFFVGIAPPSQDERWKLLEDLAAELYPIGPAQDELWDRAGGKTSDLEHSGSGRTEWHKALAKVRHGKGPGATKLLREMSKDYPMSDKIRYLRQSEEFGDRSGAAWRHSSS